MHSSEDTPGLQKQIGCMNGILQLFDRHHGGFAGRRIAGHGHGHGHRRHPPPGQCGQRKTENNSASQEETDINSKKSAKEKQRTSTESSGASFSSSSRSSTFSSVDSHIAPQTEQSTSTKCISPRAPSQELPGNQGPKPSLPSGGRCPDFHDIVKDSMYREAHGLLVRVTTKEATGGHRMKHIDSPRPLPSKSVKLIAPGSNESSRRFNKEKDGPRLLTPKEKDRPRFSYDGRETREKSAAAKLKDPPRLSLDSKQATRRCLTTELQLKSLSGDLKRENEESPNNNLQQEPGSNKRPSNLVAKLMGMEDFSGTKSIDEGQICPIKTRIDKKSHTSSRSLITDEGKQNHVAGSPRRFFENPTSPRSRNTSSASRPIPTPKFPLETAPQWQQGRCESSQGRAFKCEDSQIDSNTYVTVYDELEKRRTDIQFGKSCKYLRALEQNFEAVQKTTEQPSPVPSQTANKFTKSSSPDQSPRLLNRQNPKSDHPIPARIKGTNPPKRIVIMKPNKVTHIPASRVATVGLPRLRNLRTGDSANSRKVLAEKQMAKNRSPRNYHFQDPSSRSYHSMDNSAGVTSLRTAKTSKEFRHSRKEETISSRSTGTMRPRLQQNAQLEKYAHPTIPSLEVSMTQSPSNNQERGSGSWGTKLHPKPSSRQQSDDELSNYTYGTKNFSHRRDRDRLQSSLASQTDTEVTCTAQLNNINGSFHLRDQKYEDKEAKLREDRKIPISIQEQPSPVSVLGAMFYEDDSLSPVKKISNAFQDDETMSLNETHNSSDHEHFPQRAEPVLSSNIHHKTLELKEEMIQKLGKLRYADEPKINCIAPIGRNTSLDRGYIYEILSASCLLQKDLTPNLRAIQPHSSGHTINPNLFFVLEQTKATNGLPIDANNSRKVNQTKLNEKVHRKLVFDMVDEILVGKLALACTSKTWSYPRRLSRRSPWGQHLLIEVCSEIDRLQSNNRSSSNQDDEALKRLTWEDSSYQVDIHTEITGIVLDVERLIFKDLVAEIVKGEEAFLKDRPVGPCRQLFPNNSVDMFNP